MGQPVCFEWKNMLYFSAKNDIGHTVIVGT